MKYCEINLSMIVTTGAILIVRCISLLSSLLEEMASEKSEKYELFYSNSSVYSNFYPASSVTQS